MTAIPCGTSGSRAGSPTVKFPYQARHRVGHTVWGVHARVAEGDAGKCCGPHHLLAGLGIGGIVDRPLQVLTQQAQRFSAARSLHGLAP